MKRLILGFAAAVAAICLAGPAQAATWTDEDDRVWTYSTSDTSATVEKVEPCEYDVTIPATLGSKPVTAFCATMFKGNTKISSLEIPDGVTSIGDNAFNGCTQLQIVKFGAGLMSIGEWAFSGCSLLQKAELPMATTTLGRGAFNQCVKLTTAKLPGVTSIPGAANGYAPGSRYFDGYGAFYGCEKLKTLQLGDALTFIGHGAFYGCKELYDVEVPDSVTTIGNYSFAECSKLYSVAIGKNVKQIGCYAFDGDTHLATVTFGGTSLHTLWSGTFNGCADLNDIVLPTGLTDIKSWSFRGCTSLQAVIIPDTVTNMEVGAFANCTALRSAVVGTGLASIGGAGDDYAPGSRYFDGYGVFYNCQALTNVQLSASVKTICCGAFYGCSELPEVTIPKGVREIKGYAFAACANLQKVVVGDNVRLIGNHAFSQDIRLKTLVLGNRVQTIANNAFEQCRALQSFDFPDTVLSIGNWAFYNCDSLTDLILPDSVGTIGVGSFSHCDKLADVKIGDALEEISGAGDGYAPGSRYFDGYGAFSVCASLTNVSVGASVATVACGAFYGCASLPQVNLPGNVSSIKPYAFSSCTALKDVRMAKGGVRTIGSYAFYGDNQLEKLTLGDRLQAIGENAFKDCWNLTDVTFPETLQTLSSWCFVGCRALKSVVVPDNVVVLGAGAFACCTSLESVRIGESVLSIGGAGSSYAPGSRYFDYCGAFYGCTALKSVDLGCVATISCGAFYGCTALEDIVVPNTVKTIEPYAFANCTALKGVKVGTGLTSLGGYAFSGDGALHFVEFTGDAAPTSVGAGVFNGTKDRMTTYAAKGSTGYVGLYQPGLPSAWQGRPIAHGPVSATAGNPYDFFPQAPTVMVSRKTYTWPSPIMLRTARYTEGENIPLSSDTFKQGEQILVNYAFNEYWRGRGFAGLTNRVELLRNGQVVASTSTVMSVDAVDYGYLRHINFAPACLQGLAAGDYMLRVSLNSGRNLAETDYANNMTSVTFTVIGRAKRTITFDGNGVVCAEKSRTVWEGDAVGTLPVLSTPSGWKKLGWFTKPTGGTEVTYATVPTGNATYYAQWTKVEEPQVASVSLTLKKCGYTTGASVSPSGKSYKPGTSVTLKATPAKASKGSEASYFEGWYTDSACTKRVSTKSSYKYTIPNQASVTLYAKFVKAGFAVTATVPAANGGKATTVSGKGSVKPTVGVNFEMTLAATPNVSGSSYAATSVKVTGLKNGLTFDKKTGKITGVVTKTGKQTVKATFSNKQGWSTSFTFYINPQALPTWLVGDYDGVGAYGSADGLSQLTVGSTGKLSGKIVAGGKSYSFKADAFASCTGSDDKAVFTVRAKVNKEYTATFTFATEDGVLGHVTAADAKKKVALEAYLDIWASKKAAVPVYKSATLKLTSEALSALGVSTKSGDALSLKFNAKSKGKVTVSGALAGTKVSGSAAVVVTELAGDGVAYGEVVVTYGKKAVVVPLAWAAGVKPELATED